MTPFKDTKGDDQDRVDNQDQVLKVGDKEYSQEDLSKLVEIGERTRELEDKYNTKFDKVWPEYGRSQNKVKELETKVQELKDLKEKVNTQQQGEWTDEQIKQSKEAAKRIGLLTNEDPVVTVDKFREFYQRERSAERLLDQCGSLSKKLDGSDGRPKFDTEGILKYMEDTGVKDPELAYKTKYEKQLDSWKETKLNQAKPKGMSTLDISTAGGKKAKSVKVTSDNLNELVKEQLNL